MASADKHHAQSLLDSGVGSFGSESDSSPVQVGVSQASLCGVSQPVGSVHHKTSVFQVIYLGESQLDRRYTQPMLPWVLADVKRRAVEKDVTIHILSHCLRATDNNEHVLFEHSLKSLSRFARPQHDQTVFAYLTRPNSDLPFCCYVFRAPHEEMVPELFYAIRNASKEAIRDCDSITQGRERDTFEGRHFFEVFYVGKVIVSEKKAPPTFIDETVEQFSMHEVEKTNSSEVLQCFDQTSRTNMHTSNEDDEVPDSELGTQTKQSVPCTSSPAVTSDSSTGSSHVASENCGQGNKWFETKFASEECSDNTVKPEYSTSQWQSDVSSDSPCHSSCVHTSSGQNAPPTKNRTLLLQVGCTEISLISPDKKKIMFQRKFKDISFCSQGIKAPEHFGFISREPKSGNFLCYVFRCASEPVVEDVMQALKQAFHVAFEQRTKRNVVCELCPMHQLHKLCQEIEGLEARQAFEILQARIEQLPKKDKTDVLTGFNAEAAKDYQTMNEVLMGELRQLCEDHQKDHNHISDRTQMKSVFSLMGNKPSKFDDLKNKAKKSLTSSFGQLKKNSSIPSSSESTPCTSPSARSASEIYNSSLTNVRSPQSQSLPQLKQNQAADEQKQHRDHIEQCRNFPGDKEDQMSRSPPGTDESTPHSTPVSPAYVRREQMRQRRMSWRRSILDRVATPIQRQDSQVISEPESDVFQSIPHADNKVKRTSAALRALWKKAILETLLLIRMERENNTLQARQDAAEIKRMKLDYEEITPCLKEVTKVWDEMLLTPDKESHHFDMSLVREAVKAGVPRHKRSDIWQLLVEQHGLHHTYNPEDPGTSYEDLLKQLTTHQHAILIDLGRTFPQHPYFSTQLGPGQLALFNLLKAYSLLDREVGYCQGLSFIAGILLIHMQEDHAFAMLRYLMFQFGFRQQFSPNMVSLQIQMYQLSRLLHDHYTDLYEHFEAYEITPTLYAAPWFLTMFASQFPLGFVARVYDLIFLHGLEVVFKVSLMLLGNHKELIMECHSFESIVEFLKTTLPDLGIIQMERVINQVFNMNISKQLHAYEVEYTVLQEELLAGPRKAENEQIYKLEAANSNLKEKCEELVEQLQSVDSHNHTLESQINTLQQNEYKLKSHIKTLELERAALLNTVTKLKQFIPQEVLDAAEILIPSIVPDRTITNSPIHNPNISQLLQEEGQQLFLGNQDKFHSCTVLHGPCDHLVSTSDCETPQ